MGSKQSKLSDSHQNFIDNDYIYKNWYEVMHYDLCNYIIQILIDNNIIETNYDKIIYRMISISVKYSKPFRNKTDNVESYVFMIKSLFYIRFMYFMKNPCPTFVYNGDNVIIRAIINTFDSICKN